MPSYFDNYPAIVTVDLTSEANVTALGGVVNGTGETFDANGYTPGLTSNVEFLAGNGIASQLPVGYENGGTVSIVFEPRALGVNQNDIFDPSTANAGNPMLNDDLFTALGNTDITADTPLLILSLAAGGNEISIGRDFTGNKRNLFSSQSAGGVAQTDNTKAINNLDNGTKTLWLSWSFAGSVLTVYYYVDGSLYITKNHGNNPFAGAFDRFKIGGDGGAGIGSYAIKSVTFRENAYFETAKLAVNTFGDSFYARGYAMPGAEFGDTPRCDTQWMAQIRSTLTNDFDTDMAFVNRSIGGYGWSESKQSGGGTWLGDPAHIQLLLNDATHVIASPSVNDLLGETGSPPADLEQSARDILSFIFLTYPNITDLLLTDMFPWFNSVRDTPDNRSMTAQANAIFKSVAADYAKVTFFSVFDAFTPNTAPYLYNVGGGIESVISGAGGDDTDSDLANVHLSPAGELQAGSILAVPVNNLLAEAKMAQEITVDGQYGNIDVGPTWSRETVNRAPNFQTSMARTRAFKAGVELRIKKIYFVSRTSAATPASTTNTPKLYTWNQALDEARGLPENPLFTGDPVAIPGGALGTVDDFETRSQDVDWLIAKDQEFMPVIANDLGGAGFKIASTAQISTVADRPVVASPVATAPFAFVGNEQEDPVIYFDVQIVPTEAPILEDNYTDQINLESDVVSLDLNSNISGDTSLSVTWVPNIPNGLVESGGIVTGTVITPTGTAIATVKGSNPFGSVTDSFQWTTLTTGDPSTGINVPINEA